MRKLGDSRAELRGLSRYLNADSSNSDLVHLHLPNDITVDMIRADSRQVQIYQGLRVAYCGMYLLLFCSYGQAIMMNQKFRFVQDARGTSLSDNTILWSSSSFLNVCSF